MIKYRKLVYFFLIVVVVGMFRRITITDVTDPLLIPSPDLTVSLVQVSTPPPSSTTESSTLFSPVAFPSNSIICSEQSDDPQDQLLLVGIGAQKCGTTQFNAYLVQAVGGGEKELHYLDSHLEKKGSGVSTLKPTELNSYLTKAQRSGTRVDISPSYINFEKIANILCQSVPQAKLFALLRDPAERALSGFHHTMTDKNMRESLDRHYCSIEQQCLQNHSLLFEMVVDFEIEIIKNCEEANILFQLTSSSYKKCVERIFAQRGKTSSIDWRPLRGDLPALFPVHRGLYSRLLQPFLQRFASDRLQIFQSEYFFKHETQVVCQLLGWYNGTFHQCNFTKIQPPKQPWLRAHRKDPRPDQVLRKLSRFYQRFNDELKTIYDNFPMLFATPFNFSAWGTR
eukprot:Lithocolla_globosa_v1_NODE_4898_length_1343_cov_10.539596.p1 type:complete len:397 gc:universal NODE_4898_length_1343_cov_10.539596:124-1314(+)